MRAEGRSLQRAFVTPEGVDLRLTLAAAGTRAGAFLLDGLLMLAILVVSTIGFVYLAVERTGELLTILWLVGFFLLRNFWFVLFEMGSRGATPGKRIMGIRVVARDGARLTGAAVVARNAMREIEVFLPLSFLGARAAEGAADSFLTLFSFGWAAIFLFFPLFNRDRLRVGDLVAGTWVVQLAKAPLALDLVGSGHTHRRTFSEEALRAYGIYELQMLEQVLRNEEPVALSTVAHTIRGKFNMADDRDDYGFLADFYAALCSRLEHSMLLGQRRENKHDIS